MKADIIAARGREQALRQFGVPASANGLSGGWGAPYGGGVSSPLSQLPPGVPMTGGSASLLPGASSSVDAQAMSRLAALRAATVAAEQLVMSTQQQSAAGSGGPRRGSATGGGFYY